MRNSSVYHSATALGEILSSVHTTIMLYRRPAATTSQAVPGSSTSATLQKRSDLNLAVRWSNTDGRTLGLFRVATPPRDTWFRNTRLPLPLDAPLLQAGEEVLAILYGCETWSLATREEYILGCCRRLCFAKYLDHATETGQSEPI
jgi:hypothetical protein